METKVCTNCGAVHKRAYMNLVDGGWLCDVCFERLDAENFEMWEEKDGPGQG